MILTNRNWMGLPRIITLSKRLYQIPTTTRKIIPIYPPIQPKSDKPNTILQRIGKQEVIKDLDPHEWRRNLLKRQGATTSGDVVVESGDIVRVTYDKSKCSYDPFIGYVLSVDRKQLVQDASLLLRNQIAKTMVEVRIPIFSPLIAKIDILKKNDGKRRRNKHYYIRNTRLDVGNLEAKLRKRK